MDPIFDRLGRLIRSFGVDQKPASSRSSDPLEQEAEDELEEFLRGGDAPKKPSTQGSRTYQEQRRNETPTRAADPALVNAYAVLGVSSSSTWEEISTAHRNLIKKHHPDRHAGNETLVKQATAQSQKINEAFQVLKKHLGR